MAVKTFTTGEVLTASDTNTYLANSGLVYVASKTWSSTSSAQQIDSCFTSTYDNYRVTFVGTSNQSTPIYMYLRLVDGTTPDTAATYYTTNIYSTTSATPAANWNAAVNLSYVGWVGDTSNFITFDMASPQLATPTSVNGLCTAFGSAQLVNGSFFTYKNTSTQYEGLLLGIGGGTWAGTITVYGYRKG